jgi:hypothetical protein
VHPLLIEVDLLDLVVDASVDVLLLPKLLRRAGNERLCVVDNTADVVGNPSGPVGSVGPALEGDDL